MNDQEACCDGADCCSAPAAGGSTKSSGWKTAVFTVVILLAAAVAAYSLFGRSADDGNLAGCGSGLGGCATPCATPCGLPTVAGLDEELAGLEFALLILPHPEQELTPAITEAAAGATDALKYGGVRIRTLTLQPDNPAYKTAASRFKVDDFPAVVALGQANSMVLTQGEITGAAMLKAYQKCAADVPAFNLLGGIQMDAGGN